MILLFVFVVVTSPLSSADADERTTKQSQHYLRADPDTTCSAAYQKNPTKDTCLGTKDFFRRPWWFCVDRGSDMSSYCYSVDEAKWAKIFGYKCETGPEVITE
jgi:hypothetical protein